jgi:hypothetical protein
MCRSGVNNKQETKETLHQHNMIIKEYNWKMNMDKVPTMRISCNLNASGRIKVDITVEKAEKIIYLFIYLSGKSHKFRRN